MIDRISFFIPKLSYELFSNDGSGKKDNQVTFKGHIRIQKVLGGLVLSASLPKLIFGENISPIDRRGVKQAINMLEKTIDYELKAVHVSSIEVGSSFIMERPPPEYLQLLGLHSRYAKRPHIDPRFGITGILYTLDHANFSFQFYNKSIEVQKKKHDIPEQYQNSHILKLELKVKHEQGIERWFEGKGLTLYDLYDETVYTTLKNKFYNFYQGIEKLDRAFLFGCNEKSMVKPKEIESLFAQKLYQKFPDDCTAFITSLRAAGYLSDSSLRRIRKTYQSNSVTECDSINNKLIQELDAKVLAAVETD